MEKRPLTVIWGLSVLLVLEISIWGLITQGRDTIMEREDYLSSVIEHALQQALFTLGIGETNVIKRYWEEKVNSKGEKWTKVSEEFTISSSLPLEKVLERIKSKIEASGGEVLSYELSNDRRKLSISLGKEGKATHFLQLITKEDTPNLGTIEGGKNKVEKSK